MLLKIYKVAFRLCLENKQKNSLILFCFKLIKFLTSFKLDNFSFYFALLHILKKVSEFHSYLNIIKDTKLIY